MKKAKTVCEVKKFCLKKLAKEASGHDYHHSRRVVEMAIKIGKIEKADLFILKLSGWLHDIAHGNKDHEIKSAAIAKKILGNYGADKLIINKVCYCIKNHRFSKGYQPKTIEAKIIQDADKLDALGAIGIMRLFLLAGKTHQINCDFKVKPDFNYYLKTGRSNTTINHFYDKLFKLKNLMHTKTARKIAKKREKLMKKYLKAFYDEWYGKD